MLSSGSEMNLLDVGQTLSKFELPPLHMVILEITDFLTRFLCKRIPRYRVEMFAQCFANRLLDHLRQVVPINTEDPSKETHIFNEAGRNNSRVGPYRTSNLSFGQGKFRNLIGEKDDFENIKGFVFEVAVSIFDEIKQEFVSDAMIVDACSECCLNVAEVLRKYPPNMIIRCVEGKIFALFGRADDNEGLLGFQVYPRKTPDNENEEDGSGEEKEEEDSRSLPSDTINDQNDEETFTEEGSMISCGKLKRDIKACSRSFPPEDTFADVGTKTDTTVDEDTRSRISQFIPYRLYRKKLPEHLEENDAYYMELQVHKVPRFDYVKKKTIWVDEFFVNQRDPKFTAQTFAGTRFGSVKLKSHPYSDRGAGFYHFTMPSILPTLRLMANGAMCSTMMNELYTKPIDDDELELSEEQEGVEDEEEYEEEEEDESTKKEDSY